MTRTDAGPYPQRVYPLDLHSLTEEEVAVTFAMTSRRPEGFDQIAAEVSQKKAADFHERWVLGYGHASVAEHAIVHLAVENLSRLAADALEDNRLASYTEKSSRYQVMPEGYFHVPAELDGEPQLRQTYIVTVQQLFQTYFRLIDGCLAYLRQTEPQGNRERDGGYQLRLRRIATDSCRSVLPAATLTNVGVTANARSLEHAVSKLMSAKLAEARRLGEDIREQGRRITPTLIKYADRNSYLESLQLRSQQLPLPVNSPLEPPAITVRLAHFDQQAEEKLAAALLFQQSAADYSSAWGQAQEMETCARQHLIDHCLEDIGDHDSPPREFEVVDYTFELTMDYGAYREFKRHRMQSYFPQPLAVGLGYKEPELIAAAGLEGMFQEALGRTEEGYRRVAQFSPPTAQYLATHSHYQRILSKLNLRECYHLFKLRSDQQAHASIREPITEAMRLAVEIHPQLFRRLRLRTYPSWWPFPDKGA